MLVSVIQVSLCVGVCDTGVGSSQAKPVAETGGHQGVQGRKYIAGISTRGAELAHFLLAQWVSRLVFPSAHLLAQWVSRVIFPSTHLLAQWVSRLAFPSAHLAQ